MVCNVKRCKVEMLEGLLTLFAARLERRETLCSDADVPNASASPNGQGLRPPFGRRQRWMGALPPSLPQRVFSKEKYMVRQSRSKAR